jgi:hypothetical protein
LIEIISFRNIVRKEIKSITIMKLSSLLVLAAQAIGDEGPTERVLPERYLYERPICSSIEICKTNRGESE